MSPTDNPNYHLDWSDLAFGSKKVVRDLQATFIAAPRELSSKRLIHLVKQYLPKGNIIVGLAKEEYVLGLEGQPHFKVLKHDATAKILRKVNESRSPHKVYTLHYFQRETKYLLEKLELKKALFVNGSWHHSFHMHDYYYALAKRRLDYELISPFFDEAEAKEYAASVSAELTARFKDKHPGVALKKLKKEADMLGIARDASNLSFDHTFQTGAVLGRKSPEDNSSYSYLLHSFNKVVPYQAYAMHHGSVRETNFSAAGDLNHYDAVHAEVEMLIKAAEQGIDLKDTTLFINLMPCPTCGRMIADTNIAEVVYVLDHSEGYSVKMLKAAGKTVRRIVP